MKIFLAKCMWDSVNNFYSMQFLSTLVYLFKKAWNRYNLMYICTNNFVNKK